MTVLLALKSISNKMLSYDLFHYFSKISAGSIYKTLGVIFGGCIFLFFFPH